ncbi:MAG TPA: hypothetical protein VKB50_17345 [Vicinamibacterales bacterium]|nr:hypothetical protein [Vicinamibacterales bacterium]
MPVKKQIRPRNSSLLKAFSWTSQPARSAWRAMRTRVEAFWNRAAWKRTVERVMHVPSTMDRSTAAVLSFSVAIIMAVAVVGFRAPNGVAAGAPSTTAALHEQSSDQLPDAISVSNASAVVLTHTARSTSDTKVTSRIVTIAGCLAKDGDMFRLKDTTGAYAPRSRSWKSAFLRKSSSPVGIVDASRRLRLRSHVGERVSVTGRLVGGEMQVRSLRRVASSCGNDKPKLNA